MPVKCHHHFYNFCLFVFFPEKCVSVLGALQTHWLNLAGVTKHTHRMGNRTKEGRRGTSKYFFRIVRPFSYHGSMFPWKPNLKPVAATGVAQRKWLVLKMNQAALYLESQPTHGPQKNKPSSIFPSLIKDSINMWGKERQKIPHNENQELPFMQPTMQKLHLVSTRLKALREILHIKICKILRASCATVSWGDRRGLVLFGHHLF